MAYCLKDKRVRQDRSQDEAETEGRRVRNRAEVLHYNLCYGKEKELARQFREVQKQDLNVCKPAFHLSLSFPPGENVSKGRLVDIAKECARDLKFDRHQYVVILHKDTAHPHIHIVANRIGFDGHVMEDRKILPRVIRFCRETEQRYQLTPVKNIYRYRSPQERLEISNNPRTVRLKEEIGAGGAATGQ
ncbi:MAG TPA: relaxase/mobilization nuclease domain-containing protein [Puia sp.]|nr:relaxase/mobilization nuclease domain-containing protein [Puia sp.]